MRFKQGIYVIVLVVIGLFFLNFFLVDIKIEPSVDMAHLDDDQKGFKIFIQTELSENAAEDAIGVALFDTEPLYFITKWNYKGEVSLGQNQDNLPMEARYNAMLLLGVEDFTSSIDEIKTSLLLDGDPKTRFYKLDRGLFSSFGRTDKPIDHPDANLCTVKIIDIQADKLIASKTISSSLDVGLDRIWKPFTFFVHIDGNNLVSLISLMTTDYMVVQDFFEVYLQDAVWIRILPEGYYKLEIGV